MKLLKVFLGLSLILFIMNCVDDDQFIQESNVELEERQAGLGDGWEPAACAVLTIFIDTDACGPNWQASLPAAIIEYNSAPGVAIDMQQVFSAPADIEITCADFADNGSFGRGEWPDADGVIGGNIFMNTDFENSCTDPCFHTGSMMHEISHNLGFCHGEQEGLTGQVGPWTLNANGTFTQVNNGQSSGLEHIDGTPTGLGDPNSVFNVHNCAAPNCTLSAADIIALQTFYPLCECPELAIEDCGCILSSGALSSIWLSGDTDLCLSSGTETALVCVTNLPSGATLSSTGGSSSEVSGNCVQYSFFGTGTFTIGIEVCLDDCCRTLNRSIVVFDENCCTTCYCDCIDDDGTPIREKIPCWETESCEDLFAGDRYDCERVEISTELDFTLTGDEEICVEDGYGTFCVNGLPYWTPTSWNIYGPGGPYQEDSPHRCLSFDLDDPGTYTVTTEVCEGECCQTLMHTIVVSECSECYCECWEEVYDAFPVSEGWLSNSGPNSKGKQKYRRVQEPIDCEEDCDDVYGGTFFDCVKKMR